MKIHVTEIKSDPVREMIYFEEEQTLQIQFPNGNWYEYKRVSNSEFNDLYRARSVGKHYNFHIKGKESEEIDDPTK
jgi:hypothetical protein